MAKKSERPDDAAAGTKPDGETTVHQQLQGSGQRGSFSRKVDKMPHERDESASSTGNRLDESLAPAGKEIDQAHEDIEEGLVDTDRRGVPDDVPGSRQNRES